MLTQKLKPKKTLEDLIFVQTCTIADTIIFIKEFILLEM